MERISSRQNAIVKRFRDLARTARPVTVDLDLSARPGHSTEVLLDGEHLVQEALLNHIPIDIAAFSDRQLDNVLAPVSRIAKDIKKRGGRVLVVTDQVMAAMSPVQHPSGVIAIARARPTDIRVVMAAGAALPGAPGPDPSPAAAGGAAGRAATPAGGGRWTRPSASPKAQASRAGGAIDCSPRRDATWARCSSAWWRA